MKNSFFELIDQRLTRIPLLGRIMDERFVNYRLRATRAGAIASAIVGIGLFEYRYFVNHIGICWQSSAPWSW